MNGRVLRVESVTLARGERTILRSLTFDVARGELVALMGLSGGGKTTILRAVAGLEPFQSGTIDVDGVELVAGDHPSRAAHRDLRSRVGMVFQHHSLFEHMTALQNVTLAPMHVAKQPRVAAERRGLALLESLGVAHRRDAFPRELSGGEAQRVAIARAMAMEPPLLLMDEPTASLDPARRYELGETLRTLVREEARTLVLTTHDEDFARDFATRVIILSEGEVADEGAPAEVLDNPQHPATRALLRRMKEDL